MLLKLISLSVVLFLSTPALAEGGSASATLPLEELLMLHTRADQQEADEEAAPPLEYVVDSFDVQARIVGNAIEATASIRVTVFEEGWIRVPILMRSAGLDITSLPDIEDGSIVSDAKSIGFLTESAGSYEFELGFIKQAKSTSSLRQVTIQPAQATLRRMHLDYDAELFALTSTGLQQEGDSLVLFAKNGVFALGWKTLQPTNDNAALKKKRPPIEPVVTEGTASIVVTLDGQRISRAHYQLRLQGEQTLVVTIPEGQTLSKVYLNGISQQTIVDGNLAHLKVSPPRVGEQSAILELVLREQTDPLALTGQLGFSLPTLSWGVNELRAVLHLPDVFNYNWVGGSLSPGEVSVEPIYTFKIPTPGRSLSVSQQLVNGSPDAQIRYAVDLVGKYFR